jgi:putative transposase
MSNYRRAAVPGATYFFTVHLADRRSRMLVEHVDALRAAHAATLLDHPVHIDAMVVLPDHLHAVWRLPEGDADFPTRWRKLKARFSRAVGGTYPRSASKIRKGELGLWQRRYWEHRIRDAQDWRRHVAYCWSDPVRRGGRGTGPTRPSTARCGEGWFPRIGRERSGRARSANRG